MGFLDAIIIDTTASSSTEIKAMKETSTVDTVTVLDKIESLQMKDPLFKAVIPNFLYKPPFGMPRNINVPFLRAISQNAYIGAVIKLLQDQVASQKWGIKPIEGIEMNPQLEQSKEFIKQFLLNPNDDDESFSQILRKTMSDFAVLDSPCWVKVYNLAGELVQFRVVDGGTMVKNPDSFGRIGGRDDFVTDVPNFSFGTLNLGENDFSANKKMFDNPNSSDRQLTQKTAYELAIRQYSSYFGERAAYFQFSSSAMSLSLPVAFGKKEIIFMIQNPTSEGVYSAGSPVMNATDIAINLIYGAKYNTDFYMNSNTPEGIIQLSGAKPEQITALQNRLKESMYSYDNQTGMSRRVGYRMPVTNSEDTKFVPLNFSSKEMEIIEQQKWFTKILWSQFGVTADELGFTEDSSKNVSKDQMKAAARKAIKPYLKTIEFYINSQLIKDLPEGKNFRFEFDEYDIDEEIKKRTLQEQEIRIGIKTWQMIAEEEGLDTKELESHKKADVDRNNPNHNQDGATQTELNFKSVQAELKHKYIRREGGPGNYVYYYTEEKKPGMSVNEQHGGLFSNLLSKFGLNFSKESSLFNSALGFVSEFSEMMRRKLQNKNKPKTGGSTESKPRTPSTSSGGKRESVLDQLFEKHGLSGLSEEDKNKLLGVAREFFNQSNNIDSKHENAFSAHAQQLKEKLGDFDTLLKNNYMMHDIKTATANILGLENKDEFGKIVYEAYKDEIGEFAKSVKTSFIKFDEDELYRKTKAYSYLLGHMMYKNRDNQEFKDNFVKDLRKATNNDVAKINTVLKMAGLKERVKKEGYRDSVVTKTAEQIKETLKTVKSKSGIEYSYSPNFLKGDENFKDEAEFSAFMEETLSSIPKKALDEITKYGTKVNFLGRIEAKKLSAAGGVSNRTLGYYMPNNKQVYLFPQAEIIKSSTTLDIEKLKSAGYDAETITKVTQRMGKGAFKSTIIHELAHAASLNEGKKTDIFSKGEGELQTKYNKMLQSITDKLWAIKEPTEEDKKLFNLSNKKESYITQYAQTNKVEDFAETFAFYAMNKDFVDNQIKNKSDIINDLLLEKFKFMKEEVFN